MKHIAIAVVVGMMSAIAFPAQAGDWKMESHGDFILCDTKKNAKKYDYPKRVQGCRAIETGPYQARCTKSCMFGVKRMTFKAPTKRQIQGYNSGQGLSGMNSFITGKYPASNRQLAPYYGKQMWMKKCPLGICNHY